MYLYVKHRHFYIVGNIIVSWKKDTNSNHAWQSQIFWYLFQTCVTIWPYKLAISNFILYYYAASATIEHSLVIIFMVIHIFHQLKFQQKYFKEDQLQSKTQNIIFSKLQIHLNQPLKLCSTKWGFLYRSNGAFIFRPPLPYRSMKRDLIPWVIFPKLKAKIVWHGILLSKTIGTCFSIGMSSCQYRRSNWWNTTVLNWSYIHNGISFIGKMAPLY